VAGELLDIGFRPKLVARFDPPDAEAGFRAWQETNAETLAGVPAEALRVEYGRTGSGLYVRVRIDESQLPDGLTAGLTGPPRTTTRFRA
jgi:hypothetical protein